MCVLLSIQVNVFFCANLRAADSCSRTRTIAFPPKSQSIIFHMDLQCDGSQLCVSGIPSGADRLRLFVNGIPCWMSILTPSDVENQSIPTINIPLDGLITADTAATNLPPNALITACAYDKDRTPLGRCSLSDCPLVIPVARAGPNNGGWNSIHRLLASNLQQPGEAHGWAFHLSEALGSVPDHYQQLDAAPVVQVFFRLSFEASALSSLTDNAITVTWSCRGDPTIPPSAKRPRPLMSAAWGDQAVTTRIGNGCYDSVFLCVVPREAVDGIVRCTVQWLPASCQGVGQVVSAPSLRYSVHGHLITDLHIPTPLLLATEEAKNDSNIPGSGAAPGASVTPNNPSTSVGGGKRLAVLVGVSKYSRRRGNDLEWCDEDNTEFFSRQQKIRPKKHRKKNTRSARHNMVPIPDATGIRMPRVW